MSSPPEKIGKYEVESLLGKGAMGAVYRCRDPLMGRVVAVKRFLLGEHLDSGQAEEFRERFFQEARIAGALKHPNVITVHDADVADGVPFIVMEHMDGGSLAALMRGRGPVAPARAVAMIRQAALGLAYAHERGIIHRDIKPDNLLLDSAGRVVVTDFGAARLRDSELTRTGEVLGTPHYMSPEQVLGEPLDGRSDLFSLGVLLYLLLTGRRPFKGETVSSICYHIVHSPVEPLPDDLALPEDLRAVLARLLAKPREERYPDGTVLAADLGALEDGLAQGAAPGAMTGTLELSTPSPWAKRTHPPSSGAVAGTSGPVLSPQALSAQAPARAPRRWALPAAMLALAVAVLGAAGWIGWKALEKKSRVERPRAFQEAGSAIRQGGAPEAPSPASAEQSPAIVRRSPQPEAAPAVRPLESPGPKALAKPREPSRVAAEAAAVVDEAVALALEAARGGRAEEAGQALDRAGGRLDALKALCTPSDQAGLAAAQESLFKGRADVAASLASWASPFLDRAEAALAKATAHANTDEDAIIAAYADAYPVLRQKSHLPGEVARRADAFIAAARDELNDDEWARAEDLAKSR
jgi:predicted Ser/Thr protein kinase